MPGKAPSTPASHEPSLLCCALVVRRRVLAEVPHVAGGVLRIPVVGVLDDVRPSVLGDVVDDDRVDAHHRLVLIEHLDLVGLLAVRIRFLVLPDRPDEHREERVVDDAGEVGGLDVDAVVAAVAGIDDRRRTADDSPELLES